MHTAGNFIMQILSNSLEKINKTIMYPSFPKLFKIIVKWDVNNWLCEKQV